MLDGASLRPHVDFAALRATEFARLDAHGVAYLDHAGAALHSASQAEGHARRLRHGLYGNPHSAHAPSRASMADIAEARTLALAFFDADPDGYDIVFTANTTAAIKLVAESYGFSPGQGLVLSADNHNSVTGIREYARAADAPCHILPLTTDQRLDSPAERLAFSARRLGAGLLAFPAQSNFSGVRHDLSLIGTAQAHGFDVLIDAAGCGPSMTVSLRDHPADFLAFSFYKLFGLPTGLGALIVKRAALAKLRRPWFSGGTVDFVSVAHDRHQLSSGHHGFEDGTPNYLAAGDVIDGFRFLAGIRPGLADRIAHLTGEALIRLSSLSHSNGAPLVHLYGPCNGHQRGGVIAFNLLDRDGAVIPFEGVEQHAAEQKVSLRGGCFCNPGAAEAAFTLDAVLTPRSLDSLRDRFSIPALRQCLGDKAAVGALRLSFGAPTTIADIERAVAVCAEYAGRP